MNDGNDRAVFLAAHDVSRETQERLDHVIDTLDAWRVKSNLIGPREWPPIWQRHVWDCLGSGAGFPGLVIAAARPKGHVTMIESVGKKAAFLRAAITAGFLSADVVQGRVELVGTGAADLVTARAFAPLPRLLDYAAPWMKKGATGLFLKGERWEEELTEARQRWSFAYEAIPSQSGGAGVVLIIRELQGVD